MTADRYVPAPTLSNVLRMWCFEPGRPLPTGLGPLLGPAVRLDQFGWFEPARCTSSRNVRTITPVPPGGV
jgi:hypothetical protein